MVFTVILRHFLFYNMQFTCKACWGGRWWGRGRGGWSGSTEGSAHSGGTGPDDDDHHHVHHCHNSHYHDPYLYKTAHGHDHQGSHDHQIIILTCTMGQEGSWTWSSRFAAKAPLRKVGPRLIVMLANLRIKTVNMIKMIKMISVINMILYTIRGWGCFLAALAALYLT